MEDEEFYIFNKIYDIILDRIENPKEPSYVCDILNDPKGIDKILEKIGEESTECIIAAKNNEKTEIVYEISDLLFHIMLLMSQYDITWKDIKEEFIKRHKLEQTL
jgi:phosphoribosyl-ATP pyrophosphohydrolase